MSRKHLEELRDLGVRVLTGARTSPENAASVVEALIRAESDGIASHGLSRLPAYADQAELGKVDGFAMPELTETGNAAVRVDAKNGFAYPAVRIGLERVTDMVLVAGCAAVAIGSSHHAGVIGHHVESVAEHGFTAMGFTNSPAAIAPAGGGRAVFGTNPIAFACPRVGAAPIVIDTSLSRVARGRIKLAADRGEPIPNNWAVDREGNPTTDAIAAMQGAMLPIGGPKGSALVLMVELLTAAMTGSNAGFQASSFFDAEGPPPAIGQFFVVFDPDAFSGGGFNKGVEELVSAIGGQSGTRLPGERRLELRERAEKDGVEIADDLWKELQQRAGD